MPKVTVVIPCYNHGAFLEEAIESVCSQKYKDIQIIIVNDGSSDPETLHVLQELSKKGYRVIDIENSGVSIARNVGIGHAEGEYILPLDADDKISSNYIEEAVELLDCNDVLKVVYCNCEYFGSLTGSMILPEFSLKGMLAQNLIFNAAVFKKADFVAAGGYDPKFSEGWEDWEFWLRLIEDENEVYKLSGVYFFYRIKENSRNQSLKGARLAQVEQQLFTKHLQRFFKYYPNPLTLIRAYEHLLREKEREHYYKQLVYNSASYRIGHLILKPFRFVKEIIKR